MDVPETNTGATRGSWEQDGDGGLHHEERMMQQTEHHTHGTEHASGYGQLILVWFGLLALTGLTVALAGISLGQWIIVSALTIASIKSLLVLNVFMHLKFEDRVFRIFVGVAVATLAIFFALTFFDYAFH